MATKVNPFEVETFQGYNPYTVQIDDTPELSALLSEAEKYQGLPFDEKLETIKNIALRAMRNAYEEKQEMNFGMGDNAGFQFWSTCDSIVTETHSLGFALKAKAGCCRYQSVLFLLLGAAAKLGDKHYLQGTPIHSGLNTCYNDVEYEGKVHHVSIFVSSLQNKKHDYSAHLGTKVFENPYKEYLGQTFLAYVVDNEGVVHRYAREGRHFNS